MATAWPGNCIHGKYQFPDRDVYARYSNTLTAERPAWLAANPTLWKLVDDAEPETEKSSGLSPPVTITFLADKFATALTTKTMTLPELGELIRTTTASSKDKLPWLKLAEFGDNKSKKGSLRHDANVRTISGVELDYDAKTMPFDTAVEIIKKAGVRALLYTTPSHTDAASRWRVLCPTSIKLPAQDRAKLVARINGVVGGVFATESFTLSQGFFYGSINNNPAHCVVVVDGDFIDDRGDLDAGAIGKATPKNENTFKAEPPIGAEPVTLAMLKKAGVTQDILDVIMAPPQEITAADGETKLKGGAAHFKIVCDLIRHKFDDSQITEVYRGHKIGDGPRSHPAGFDRYMAKVLASARLKIAQDDANAKDERVALFQQLNLDNFVIDAKGVIGTFVVTADRYGHMRRHLLMRSPAKFSIAHPQPMMKCEWTNNKRPLGEVWSKDVARRHYPDITFDPTSPPVTADGMLNLYCGPGIVPKEGDWHLMREHITRVLAGGDAKGGEYIINWHAWGFQNPGTVAGVALGFRGKQGIGKGVVLRTMKRCHGQHGMQTTKMDQVLGRFNSILEDTIYLYLNEAHVPKDPDKLGSFKSLITDPEMSIERKGVDITREWPNNLHIVMDGNDEHLAPIAGDDRRFAIFESCDIFENERDVKAAKQKYFDALYDEIENGGDAAMLYDMLHIDLGKWRPDPAYQNAAHRKQKALSLKGADLIVERILQDQHLPGGKEGAPRGTNWCRSHGGDTVVLGNIVHGAAGILDEKFGRACGLSYIVSDKAKTLALARYGGTSKQDAAGRCNGWEFKSPAECRALWEKAHGGAWDWVAETRAIWGADHDPIPL